MNDLQTKIHAIVPLRQLPLTDHVNVLAEVLGHGLHRDPPARLYRHVRILLLERLGVLLQSLRREVVQHHHVGPCPCRHQRLLEGLTLHLYFLTEPADAPRLPYGRLDRSAAAPNVIVLQHDHLAQVQPVGGGTAHQESVLFDEAESRRRLSCARHLPVPAIRFGDVHAFFGQAGDAAAPRHRVEGRSLPPEEVGHRARDRGQFDLFVLPNVEQFSLDGVVLPLYIALPTHLEHRFEEGYASQDARALHPQFCRLDGGSNDVPADIEVRGDVILEPPGHDGAELGRGEEGGMGGVGYRFLAFVGSVRCWGGGVGFVGHDCLCFSG
mmetsp:Transcript_16354/g.35576  ORF Transcript_16354/g.35576 Transcript_16354/m.35576 type:complete len:325 (+) Transcript_16354:48-1022(+)